MARRRPATPQPPRGPSSGAPTTAALPHVLFVENSLRENGGLRVSLEHARRFRVAGAPVTVAVVQDVTGSTLASPDPSLRVEMLTRQDTRLRVTALLALTRLVRRARQADVVVSGSEIGNCLLFGFLAARLARRPFAVLVQADLDGAIADWVPRPLRRPTRWVHAHADAAVCVADSVAQGVLANGLPADRVHVVVNGIDVAAVRAHAGLPPLRDDGSPAGDEPGTVEPLVGTAGVPVVVANGRLSTAKAFPRLVRAHARVLAAGVPHHLVIMGEGPARDEIEATVAELGVGDSVTLTGFAAQPYSTIAAADLFVLSSDTEGLPLTLMEALAVGAPILSTRCGTGPDLLLDGGRYGELVPAGSLEDLAEAIERHLRDPDPLRRRATAGPARALAFDAGRAASAVLQVLAGLVAARAVSPAARG